MNDRDERVLGNNSAAADVSPEYAETVVDPDGVAHVIPYRILDLGIDICEQSFDPFDPSGAPSLGAMARAYIAIAHALGSLSPAPKTQGEGRHSVAP